MEDTKSILSLLSRGRTNSQKVRNHKRNSMNMTVNEVRELEEKIGQQELENFQFNKGNLNLKRTKTPISNQFAKKILSFVG